ncbi:MAG: GNAT family N-acetyltransferase [Proteobacteria bacterium]|nr:GNAT family N-acetyltransferase [Pseudomonadota bacterium]
MSDEPVTVINRKDLGALRDANEVKSRWALALDPSQNLYAMYLAPEWLEASHEQAGASCSVLCAGVDGENLEVLAAIRPAQARLRFELSTALQKAIRLQSVEILGSQILGEMSPDHLAAVVSAVWKEFPSASAIYFKSVQKGSPLWEALEKGDWRVGSSIAYRQHGDRPFHSVQLPGTFEEYVAQFPSKQRYNLKKKVRKMADATGGKLEVRQANNPEDIPFLVASARAVAAKSWKAKRLANPVPDSIENEAQLRRIAERGMLRAFVLQADGVPCAFIVGYLYRGVFHYADLAYDETQAVHSPGTILLYLILEMLIEKDHAQFVNFGITDAQYKQVFGNRHTEEAEILLMRPGVGNRTLIACHRLFQRAKLALRSKLSRRKVDE